MNLCLALLERWKFEAAIQRKKTTTKEWVGLSNYLMEY
jgi:hypothetical protein